MSSGAQWAQQYGPWAVVAGGSEGVGAEFAFQLAEAGIDLVLIARKPEPLRDTADQCRARGVRVRELAVDLTAADAVTRIAEATSDIEVGLLIYNAGANTHSAEFLDGDPAAFERVLDLNVRTPLAFDHHFGSRCAPRRGALVHKFGSALNTIASTSRHSAVSRWPTCPAPMPHRSPRRRTADAGRVAPTAAAGSRHP